MTTPNPIPSIGTSNAESAPPLTIIIATAPTIAPTTTLSSIARQYRFQKNRARVRNAGVSVLTAYLSDTANRVALLREWLAYPKPTWMVEIHQGVVWP